MDGRRCGWLLVVFAVVVAACGPGDQAADVGMRDPAFDGGSGEVALVDVDYRAERAGVLPSMGASSVVGVALPAGHLVSVDPSFVAAPEEAPSGPVAWVSDEPVPEVGALWSELAARFPETGLWPLVLEPFAGGDDTEWWDGGLDPTMSRQPGQLASIDLESTLSAWWSDSMPSAEELEDEESGAWLDEMLAPFGQAFPGLAAPPDVDAAPVTTASVSQGYLGLVAVERPADAPLAMGWTGPINYYNDIGPLTVVLHSWEDRYGAVVVALGFDTLSMVVRRPPQTENDTTAIAAEHFAACPDLVWQGTDTIAAYASVIQGQVTWSFWWD